MSSDWSTQSGWQDSRLVARISVVVISKDEPALATTLDELRAQCVELGAECVVIDASLGRLQGIRDDHPWVNWNDYVRPAGRAITIPHQRNAGVAIATGEVIAFCDVGGIPEHGWLSRLTAPIISGSATATGGPVRSLRPSSYGTLNDLPSGSVVRRVVTCNFAFSRALFDRIGGFDERFDYGSDTEFGWRIEGAGESVVSVADAIVTIDWGSHRRQLKRDLHYGEAKARQVLLCPGQRRRILQDSPEVLVYPLLFLTAPFAVLGALVWRRWSLAAPWALGCALVYGRDLRFRRPHGAMLD
ncbi:MAG TPA: glycosyltransferase, partial [Acidimicrobiales bacterium]